MNICRNILITGGTGLLGKGMLETAPESCRIVSLHQRDYTVEGSRIEHVVLDVRDKHAVDRFFEKRQFDAVVHAAGTGSVDYVEKHYAESLESNIMGTLNIIAACRLTGTYMVYVSSNAVFDGTEAPYSEEDPIRPINKYGRMKAECEHLVNEILQHRVIVRPILMYGWNRSAGRSNPVSWLFEKFQRRERVQVVNDVYENPLYNWQCGEALWQIVMKRPSGVFHLAGGDVLNRYELALAVARIFEFDPSSVQEVDSSFFSGIAPRPKNTTFITSRMEKELGIQPLKFDAGLQHMKKLLELEA